MTVLNVSVLHYITLKAKLKLIYLYPSHSLDNVQENTMHNNLDRSSIWTTSA